MVNVGDHREMKLNVILIAKLMKRAKTVSVKKITCHPTCQDGFICIEGQCDTDGNAQQDGFISDLGQTEETEPIDESIVAEEETLADLFVAPLEGLATSENGTTSEVLVVLNQKPESPVTIPLESNSPIIGKPNPDKLFLTPENWDKPQSFVIEGTKEHLDQIERRVKKLA